MDPLTHALSGAVAGRAFVREPDTLQGRAARAALFLGAIFPDSDVLLNLFEPNGLGTIRFHRGVTHSYVCAPLFAAALGALAVWVCRRLRIASPSWARMSCLFAAGITLHISFDLITSFGTMIWSPIDWGRASLDITFILDPLLTVILLLPLLLGWAYGRRENAARRAALLWVGLSILAVGVVSAESYVQRSAAATEALPFDGAMELLPAPWIAGMMSALVACVLGLPTVRGKGVSRRAWCMAGTKATVMYLALSAGAHHVALGRVQDFARSRGLPTERIGALPMPPSLLFWAGLVSAPDGVYYSYFSLLGEPPQFRKYDQPPPPDGCTQAALASPNVETVLRFARFPLIVQSPRDAAGRCTVDFFDLRFLPRRGDALSFSYRVKVDGAGSVVEQGWIRSGR